MSNVATGFAGYNKFGRFGESYPVPHMIVDGESVELRTPPTPPPTPEQLTLLNRTRMGAPKPTTRGRRKLR